MFEYGCGHSENYTPYSNGNFIRQNITNEGDSFSMSMCCAFVYNNATYLAADSVSAEILDYSIFGGAPIAYKPISFSEEKIIKLPIENRNVFVIIVGLNRIQRKTIKSFILETNFNKNDSITVLLNDIIKNFNKQAVCQTDAYTELRAFEYQKTGNMFTDTILYNWKTKETINNGRFESFSNDSDLPKRFLMGQDWAKLIANYVYFEKEELSTEDTVSRINEIYNRIKEASRYFNSTVGGLIRILKITPEGYEWLQNEPNIPE